MKKEQVFEFLQANCIKYQVYYHEACVSVEDSKKIIHIEGALGCKSLFVKDKKSDRFFMAVLPADKRADMRGLARYVDSEKFEFATAEKMLEYLDVVRGNVTPFSFLYPNSVKVGLMIDEQLTTVPKVRFHPCDNTASVVLESKDFFKCMDILGKRYIITQ